MGLIRTSRLILTGLVVAAVGYWLFADTVARHSPADRDAGGIRFAYWGGLDDHRMWAKVIAAFEARHPDLHIRPEWLPLSGYNTKIDQQFVAGSAPDVMLFQDEPFPRYAGHQFIALDRFLDGDPKTRRRLADCWPTAAASFIFEGSLRGIPIMGGTVLVYCNPHAFERAARFHGRPVPLPDADWALDDFVATCRDLTFDEDGDGRIDQFGLLQPHWVYYLPFIWSHGAALLDKDRSHWTLMGPEAVSALTLYADLRHRWGVTPMPIEYAGQNSDTAFLSGRVAMCVNGPWFQAFLRQTAMHGRYRVAPIPRGPGGSATRVTWDGLCLYAGSSPQRQADAWQFVRFVLTVEAQRTFAAHQRAVPARRAVAGEYILCGGGEDSPAAAFVAAMQNARMQPITPAWHVMSRAMWRHITSLLLEGEARQTPEEALAALANEPAIRQAFGGGR